MIAQHFAVSLACAYILYSFVEYSVHRWAMHRMRIAKALRSSFLRVLCYNHMALHHKRDYRHETDEKDDRLSHISIAGIFAGAPVAALMYWIDPFTLGVTIVFGMFYSVFWWIVHTEMHRDKGTFFSKNAVFRYLEYRHQLHHEFPGTNYNVVLPLFDWVFRTYKVPERKRPSPSSQTSH